MVNTSLIPSVVALCQFFVNNFPNYSWYPYSYLGNPFEYLIGPVVPFLILILAKIGFTNISINYYFLIFVSSLLTGLGTYFFVKELIVDEKQAKIISIINLVAPFSLGLLFFGNGLSQIAFSFLPFILLIFLKFFFQKGFKWEIILCLLITADLLIDVSIFLPLVIALASLLITLKDQSKNLGLISFKLILIFILAIILSTIWYQASFWWTLFTNPSFGGVPLINLIHNLFNLALNLVPLSLALFYVKFKQKNLSKHLKFALIFSGSFLFLSVIRFVSDPDFIIDWTSYLTEVQFGLSFLVGYLLIKKIKPDNLKPIFSIITLIFILLTAYMIWAITNNKNNAFEQKITSILLRNISATKRVFLSGSSVFWINSKINVSQVRGNNDSASINPVWAMAAYQIREGSDLDLTDYWLKNLGVSEILIHQKDSGEYFHDFKYTQKFEQFKKLDGDKKDQLFSIDNSSIARKASGTLMSVPKPRDGADLAALKEYNSNLLEPVKINFPSPNIIILEGDIGNNELISLAITYHPNWRLLSPNATITRDNLGNMVVIPKGVGYQKIILKYENPLNEKIILVLLASLTLIALYYSQKIYPFWKKFVNKLSFGLDQNDEG